jgi:hypothetical protein
MRAEGLRALAATFPHAGGLETIVLRSAWRGLRRLLHA